MLGGGNLDRIAMLGDDAEVMPSLSILDGTSLTVLVADERGVVKTELLHLHRHLSLTGLDLHDGRIIVGLRYRFKGMDAAKDEYNETML